MSQSIALADKYMPLLDEVFKNALVTKDLEKNVADWDGGSTVKVYKLSLTNLKAYNRQSGFATGDVTGTWESLALTQDRGIKFVIDEMDDDETLGVALPKTAAEVVRTQAVPECDTYRFGTIATWILTNGTSGTHYIASGAALSTGANVLAAIEVAEGKLDDNEAPSEGRILYITPTCYNLLKGVAGTRYAPCDGTEVNRNFEYFDGMKVVKVPQGRFVTKVAYDGTTGAIGKDSTNGGKNINFMIIHPDAICAVAKQAKLGIIAPEFNNASNGYIVKYRLYHDVFVYSEKKGGIYLHYAAA